MKGKHKLAEVNGRVRIEWLTCRICGKPFTEDNPQKPSGYHSKCFWGAYDKKPERKEYLRQWWRNKRKSLSLEKQTTATANKGLE